MTGLNTIPPLVEPPPSEIMPFESFESLMNSTTLDEVYKYYDSDGTVDLEDTYDGASACEEDEVPPIAEDKDPDFDIREAERYDRADASRHNDSKLHNVVYNTQAVLERLSIAAQPILEEQPMSTRIVLANQAVNVFERYGSHGSMHRYSEDVRRFLEAGQRVRRPGVEGRDPKKDAILRFAPVNPAKAGEGASIRVSDKKGSKRKDDSIGQDGGVRKERKIETESVISAVKIEKPTHGLNPTASTEPEKKDIVSTRNKSVKPKPVLPHIYTGPIRPVATMASNDRPIHVPASPSSALARFNLNSPVSQPPPLLAVKRHAYSCTTHPSLNANLATQPFEPISLNLTWPATSRENGCTSMPTPGLLDALNNIVHLHNAEGRFMLSYYVRKFDTPIECGGSGSGPPKPNSSHVQKVEPPHALFRLGISQYLWSKVGKVIDNKEVDELGLNPEARRLLGEVWERHPSTAAWWHDSLPISQKPTNTAKHGEAAASANNEDEDPYEHESDFNVDVSEYDTSDLEDDEAMREQKLMRKTARAVRRRKRHDVEAQKRKMALGGLNPWEKIILARATNISVKAVDVFWDDMREKTKAWGAMKMWCAAMEKRMIKKAKVEGRW